MIPLSLWLSDRNPLAVYRHYPKAKEFTEETGYVAGWPHHPGMQVECMPGLIPGPSLRDTERYCFGWEMAAWMAKDFAQFDATLYVSQRYEYWRREIFNRSMEALRLAGF